MKLRRIGQFLIGLAVLIGTPIAISFIDFAQISCPAPAEFPEGRSGEDWRFINRGAIVRDRVVDEGAQDWWRSHGRGSALSVRWEFSESRVRLNIPIWPLPAVLAVAGVCCLWLARDREAHTPGAMLRQRILTAGVAGAAIATTSVLVLSFAGSGGASLVWPVIDDRVHVYAVGAEQGSLFAEHWNDANHRTHAPIEQRGPISLRWHRAAGSLQIALPLWPLPLALLGTSWWLHRRANRSRRWAAQGRCQACGYSLAGLGSSACPECGAETAGDRGSTSLASNSESALHGPE